MIIHTMAEGISIARKLENDSAAFYVREAPTYPAYSQIMLTFAAENQKYLKQIEQTYYGVITDAIEGCFVFNLETNDFILETAQKISQVPRSIIEQSVQMEEKILQFYISAAEQSKSLIGDIARSFTLTAKKRKTRLTLLAELMDV